MENTSKIKKQNKNKSENERKVTKKSTNTNKHQQKSTTKSTFCFLGPPGVVYILKIRHPKRPSKITKTTKNIQNDKKKIKNKTKNHYK